MKNGVQTMCESQAPTDEAPPNYLRRNAAWLIPTAVAASTAAAGQLVAGMLPVSGFGFLFGIPPIIAMGIAGWGASRAGTTSARVLQTIVAVLCVGLLIGALSRWMQWLNEPAATAHSKATTEGLFGWFLSDPTAADYLPFAIFLALAVGAAIVGYALLWPSKEKA
ncbi:hypothetical protein [Burkholderia cenocepacia]|uniref:hypothetical protein n=1 Tax=Burkholderia cenocepacia TaxID=95486 RepID=UPI000F5AD91B|nr:hypothetical protein [Burkholderia cenocepacia]RQU83927.1 hypothetical protein DF040_33950 [Burkholderia cenocepacia]